MLQEYSTTHTHTHNIHCCFGLQVTGYSLPSLKEPGSPIVLQVTRHGQPSSKEPASLVIQFLEVALLGLEAPHCCFTSQSLAFCSSGGACHWPRACSESQKPGRWSKQMTRPHLSNRFPKDLSFLLAAVSTRHTRVPGPESGERVTLGRCPPWEDAHGTYHVIHHRASS